MSAGAAVDRAARGDGLQPGVVREVDERRATTRSARVCVDVRLFRRRARVRPVDRSRPSSTEIRTEKGCTA